MQIHETTPAELLGPLNEVEKKHASESLFYSGDAGFLQTGARVAIVGSRKASPEGLARAGRLAALLAKQNSVIVSGLAEGIAAAAHTKAISEGARTIGDTANNWGHRTTQGQKIR